MRPQCDKDGTVAGCSELLIGMALALLVCLVLSLCSCKPAKEVQFERVEVPVVVTQEHTIESVKIDHVRDTLIQRDSIYHYVQGDTTIIERWHHTQGQTIVTRVDTLHVFDSVPYPVEVTKERIVTKIEEVNVLRWWQKLLMGAGGLALIALGLFGAYKLGKR